MAKVTIITPTYHQKMDTLRRCVSSVGQQTFTNWIHWICSDGEHEAEVEDWVRLQPGVKYWHTAVRHKDWGAGVRKALMPEVTSEYVAFLDSDNMLFPRFLAAMLSALDSMPSAGFAICAALHFGPVPGVRQYPVVLPGEPRVGQIDTIQVVARTAAMQDVGWVTDEYTADGLTYERLAKAYEFVRIPEVLAVHL